MAIEVESISPKLRELAELKPDRSKRATYNSLKREAMAMTDEYPKEVSDGIEFIFRNPNLSTPGMRFEAVGLLYHLGSFPDHRGRALELLGLAEQDPAAIVSEAAVHASNGVTRRGQADHLRKPRQK